MLNPWYNILPVETIANKILEISKKYNLKTPTNITLNHLTYLCQGYSLGILGHPLFDEHIEAWLTGPIIPKLYFQFMKYNLRPITKELDIKQYIISDSDIGELIEKVVKKHNTSELDSFIKTEESPWDINVKITPNKVIPLWQIALYFIDSKL